MSLLTRCSYTNFQFSSNGLSFLSRSQHNCNQRLRTDFHTIMVIYRGAGMYHSCVCVPCTPTLGLWTHTGSTEEGSCRRILDDMSIICRQVLTGRVGKRSNETARGIEKNSRKSKAQVSNGRTQAMYAGQILSFPSIRKAYSRSPSASGLRVRLGLLLRFRVARPFGPPFLFLPDGGGRTKA